MGTVWEKLFGNSLAPVNDLRALAVRYQPEEETPGAKPGSVIKSLGGLAAGGQGRAAKRRRSR